MQILLRIRNIRNRHNDVLNLDLRHPLHILFQMLQNHRCYLLESQSMRQSWVKPELIALLLGVVSRIQELIISFSVTLELLFMLSSELQILTQGEESALWIPVPFTSAFIFIKAFILRKT